MVALFIVLTILTFLTVDYFLQRRQFAKATAKLAMANGAEIDINALPSGLFVDKGHTWTELNKDGEVSVGMDELPAYAMGDIDEVRLMKAGSHVKRGEPFIVLRSGARSLALRSPISGEIREVNESVLHNPANAVKDPYGQSWFYRVAPKTIGDYVNGFLIGDMAKSWMKSEIATMRDFLASSAAANNPAFAVLQDGGMPVRGFVQQMDEQTFDAFALWMFEPEKR